MCRYVRARLASARRSGASFCIGFTSANRQVWPAASAPSIDQSPSGTSTGRVSLLGPSLDHVPDGAAADLAAACADYEERIAATGPVDLQILGIGANGHIGFNEPTSSFASRTRIKTLAPKTRADNARFFDSPDQVPMHCLTQGLGTILDARHLVMLATGTGKAEALKNQINDAL